jgi:hypothetical protein
MGYNKSKKQSNLALMAKGAPTLKTSPLNHSYNGQTRNHRHKGGDESAEFIIMDQVANQGVEGYGTDKLYDKKVYNKATDSKITANEQALALSQQIADYYNSGALSGGTFGGPNVDQSKSKFGFDYNKYNRKFKINLGGKRTNVNSNMISEGGNERGVDFGVTVNDQNAAGGYDNIPENQVTAEQIQQLMNEGKGFVSLDESGFFPGANNTMSNTYRPSTRASRSQLPQSYQNSPYIQPGSYIFDTSPDAYNEEEEIGFDMAAYETSPEGAAELDRMGRFQEYDMQGLTKSQKVMAERKRKQQAEAAVKKEIMAANLAKREKIMEARKIKQQEEAAIKNERIAAALAEKEARRNN